MTSGDSNRIRDIGRGRKRVPLTNAEVAGLWQAERRAMRLYVAALSVMAAGFGVIAFSGLAGEWRYVVLLLALALLTGAIFIQLALRCPRCSARLAVQSPLLLPDTCKSCGVAISRPPDLDSELDV
jgi:peptidoglycan/LPS O-acetylase OafA/YrhL